MAKWTLYHNPKCSKSREALALLQSQKIQPAVVEYLKTQPTETELRSLIAMLEDSPAALVRTKEEDYQNSKFDLNSIDEIVKHLAKNPKLIERPIVIKDKKAVIARPVEKIEKFL